MPYNVWNESSDKWENLTSFATRGQAENFLAEICVPDRGVGLR